MRQALAALLFLTLATLSVGVAKAGPNPAFAGASVEGAFSQKTVASQSAVDVSSTSPDVAEWTSRLVITSPAHRGGFGRFAGGILARTSKIAQQLTRSALRFLGTPYVFGGTSPTYGFDCSAYVQHVFAMVGIHLPRTADAQYDVGHPATGGPRPGDLVFFQTYAPGVSHVGIYLGNGKFAHASSSRGVTVSSLSESYWAQRYLGAKRLIATASH